MKESHDPSNLRKFLESAHYHDLKTKMNAEIQHPRTIVDRACFSKTPQEKAEMKNIISLWKKVQKLNEE